MVSEKVVVALMILAIVLSGISLIITFNSDSQEVQDSFEENNVGTGDSVALFVEDRGDLSGS
jgi:hypothetical protein|tara:strand:- start:5272 stop:5457 length:186 start_codon:yes stop_codon:yes gene_type:complete